MQFTCDIHEFIQPVVKSRIVVFCWAVGGVIVIILKVCEGKRGIQAFHSWKSQVLDHCQVKFKVLLPPVSSVSVKPWNTIYAYFIKLTSFASLPKYEFKRRCRVPDKLNSSSAICILTGQSHASALRAHVWKSNAMKQTAWMWNRAMAGPADVYGMLSAPTVLNNPSRKTRRTPEHSTHPLIIRTPHWFDKSCTLCNVDFCLDLFLLRSSQVNAVKNMRRMQSDKRLDSLVSSVNSSH